MLGTMHNRNTDHQVFPDHQVLGKECPNDFEDMRFRTSSVLLVHLENSKNISICFIKNGYENTNSKPHIERTFERTMMISVFATGKHRFIQAQQAKWGHTEVEQFKDPGVIALGTGKGSGRRW